MENQELFHTKYENQTKGVNVPIFQPGMKIIKKTGILKKIINRKFAKS